MWTQREAVNLATIMESYAAVNNLHVALTGGCLYKVGERKDADFIIYRNNTPESIDTAADLQERRANFEKELALYCNVRVEAHYGYLTKAVWSRGGRDRPLDLMYPELRKPGEEYVNQEVGPVGLGTAPF